MAGEALRATAGPAAGLRLPIDGELQLGRAAPGFELLLADAELSRNHASIHRDDDGALVIEDLGSRNGTFPLSKRTSTGWWVTTAVVRISGRSATGTSCCTSAT